MSAIEHREIDFELLCDNFPKHCEFIRMLARLNPTFSAVCEDYCLAYTNLKQFETDLDGGWEVEIADFRVVVAELGAELTKSIQRGKVPEVVASPVAGRPDKM